MKKLCIALACVLLATPCFADIPAKSELSVSGTFVRPKNAGNVYALDFALAAPLNKGGNVLLGPKAHLDSDQAARAVGAVLEWNLLGTAKSGPFVGANGLYNLKEVAGTERYTADAVAGFKIALGKGGSGFKVYASKGVAGRGKDRADYIGNVGLLVRF